MWLLRAELQRNLIDDRTDTLATHLHNAAGLLLCGDDLMPFCNGMDHRFFAVHVLACFHCVDGSLRVPVVRGRDDDGIDVLACENLAIVGGRKHATAKHLAGVLPPACVQIGGRDNGHTRYPASDRGIGTTTVAEADEGNL